MGLPSRPNARFRLLLPSPPATYSFPKFNIPEQEQKESKPKEWVNPFLPYEEALWVAHLSPTHTLLLNKFNVVAKVGGCSGVVVRGAPARLTCTRVVLGAGSAESLGYKRTG